MRKQYIRWILPVLAMLLIATMLVLAPMLTHAAPAATPKQATPISAPATPTQKVTPNVYWQF